MCCTVLQNIQPRSLEHLCFCDANLLFFARKHLQHSTWRIIFHGDGQPLWSGRRIVSCKTICPYHCNAHCSSVIYLKPLKRDQGSRPWLECCGQGAICSWRSHEENTPFIWSSSNIPESPEYWDEQVRLEDSALGTIRDVHKSLEQMKKSQSVLWKKKHIYCTKLCDWNVLFNLRVEHTEHASDLRPIGDAMSGLFFSVLSDRVCTTASIITLSHLPLFKWTCPSPAKVEHDSSSSARLIIPLIRR